MKFQVTVVAPNYFKEEVIEADIISSKENQVLFRKNDIKNTIIAAFPIQYTIVRNFNLSAKAQKDKKDKNDQILKDLMVWISGNAESLSNNPDLLHGLVSIFAKDEKKAVELSEILNKKEVIN